MVSCADIGRGFFWSVWWRDAGTRGGLADGSIRVWEDGVIRVHLGWHWVDNVFANPRAAPVLLRLLRSVPWVQHGWFYAIDHCGKRVDGQQSRASAMSIVIGGSSIAGLLVPPIVWGISAYGWRPTVLVIGIITLLVGPIVARVIGKRPTPEQLAEQIQSGAESGHRTRQSRLYDFTPSEALKTRAFWSISMTHMLVNLSTGAISAHLFLHLTDGNGVNLDDAAASGVVPILVVTAFVSQLTGGIMGDRMNKRVLVPFLLLLQSASLVILAFANSFAMAAVFAVVWGVGFGARTPLLHAMRGEYFGRRHFGTILGLSSFPMSIGMMATPFVIGLVHDIQGTYVWSLYVLAGACVVASVTILFATRPMSPGLRRRVEARAARRKAARLAS